MALLWETLVRFELAAKSSRAQLRPPAPRARGRRRVAGAGSRIAPMPREAAQRLMPALPLDEAGKYVAGAYVVFLALLLIYVAIMSIRLGRIDRELAELAELAEQRRDTSCRVDVRASRGRPSGRRAEESAACLNCSRSASPTRPRRWSCASEWR